MIHKCLRPNAMQGNDNAKPNIVDVLLIHIFRMGQGVCIFLFCV